MAKKETLTTQTPEQLRALLAGERGTLLQLRQDLIGKKLSDTTQIGRVRREIARILTALRQSK